MKKGDDPFKLNFLGMPLKVCSKDPLTGFFRDGTCYSNPTDPGNHSVCSRLTDEFLDYTKSQGNDLRTPNPRYGFPGLKAGDRWCLCAGRWKEAKEAGIDIQIDIKASSQRAFEISTDFDFRWKYRVLRCDPKVFAEQVQLFQKNQPVINELKLVIARIPGLEAGCRLIGLDGEEKYRSNTPIDIKELERIINSMPMRQSELNEKQK